MARHRTKWWTRLFPTPPDEFVKTPEGELLLRLLTEWWLTGEGVLTATTGEVRHGQYAVLTRYDELALFRMLKRANYPTLGDRDEHAMNQVYQAFLGWASSAKARKLLDSSDLGRRVRQQLEAASSTDRADWLPDDLLNSVAGDLLHGVHSQIHHAISHAATSHGGHGGGGHHGGGHGGGHH